MTGRVFPALRRFLPLLLVLCAVQPGLAQAGLAQTGLAQPAPAEPRAVARALDAIEACMHWVSEPGEGDAARSEQIARESRRYCDAAQRQAEAAYRRYPGNARLAAGALSLLDIGYFDIPAARVCQSAAPYFRAQYADAHEADNVLLSRCPAQAKAVYGGR